MPSKPETRNLKPGYAMLGKFTATPSNGDALADRLLQAAAQMGHAPGCLQYYI